MVRCLGGGGWDIGGAVPGGVGWDVVVLSGSCFFLAKRQPFHTSVWEGTALSTFSSVAVRITVFFPFLFQQKPQTFSNSVLDVYAFFFRETELS